MSESVAQVVPEDAYLMPASFAQQRLWFLDQFEPNNAVYNIPVSYRILGPYNVDAVRRSLTEIVRRHEALRTTFLAVEGWPKQVIRPPAPVDLALVNLRSMPASQREAEAARLAEADARQPFDLARGPLLRATLLQLDDADHILVLTLHHIIADGWSMQVLQRELGILYDAYASGRESPLPELRIQYADYSEWQTNWLQGEVLATQVAYWKQQLAGAPEVIELPSDRPRPPVQNYSGALYPFELGPDLTRRTQALAQREGATLFMVLLAAYATLLGRYTGQSDLIIGAPIANRTRAELEDLIGFFVNSLALRVDLSGRPTFRELLRRVREVTLDAYAHQDLPFEKLVEELHPQRGLSYNPIFQVMFVLQNAPGGESGASASGPSGPAVGTGTTKFDLTLALSESPSGLVGGFEYGVNMFDQSTIERMARSLTTVIAAAVANPDQRVTELPILSPADREWILKEWNATAQPFADGRRLTDVFQEQVARAPHAEALRYGGQSLTYEALNARANRLAHALQRRGVQRESTVAICLERDFNAVIAMLGVLKAGGAFVPLDPDYPRDRLAYMLADSGARLLLTTAPLERRLSLTGVEVGRLEEMESELAAGSIENPRTNGTSRDLAYVIYTSGSTGRPKGVMVEHRGLCNLPVVQSLLYEIGPGSRVLQFAPLCFDTSVAEIVLSLTAGATLCMGTPDEMMAGPPLASFMRREQVTHAILSPAVVALIPEAEARHVPLVNLAVAGDVCSVDLAVRWAKGRRFFNSYGPTETTIWATSWRGTDALMKPPPIGKPIANHEVYVLDANLQPVPIGVTGEIYIGGISIARGYRHRPDLTAAAFIPDPFSGRRGARLYRTGDLGRLAADGNLDFLGRADQQVKIRGFRVEPQEVAAALGQHEGVGDAVVVVRPDPRGDKQLVGFWVARHQVRVPTIAELRRHLQERLPDYMVPASLMRLDAMPLTPNGKVDLRALPPIDDQPLAPTTAYVPPATPTEERVAAIWCSVLALDTVGRHDHFFDLGGHSLLATRVLAQLREVCHVELPLRRLFENPVLMELAAAVDAALQAPAAGLDAIKPVSRQQYRVRTDGAAAGIRTEGT